MPVGVGLAAAVVGVVGVVGGGCCRWWVLSVVGAVGGDEPASGGTDSRILFIRQGNWPNDSRLRPPGITVSRLELQWLLQWLPRAAVVA